MRPARPPAAERVLSGSARPSARRSWRTPRAAARRPRRGVATVRETGRHSRERGGGRRPKRRRPDGTRTLRGGRRERDAYAAVRRGGWKNRKVNGNLWEHCDLRDAHLENRGDTARNFTPAVSQILGSSLADQGTERVCVCVCVRILTHSRHRAHTNHSGRKAASRNSRGRCGGPPCLCPVPVQSYRPPRECWEEARGGHASGAMRVALDWLLALSRLCLHSARRHANLG